MGEIIAFTGRGGAGKSVCAANISYALSLTGKKVMLIDCDCGMRTQDIIFGIENDIVYSFYDAAIGACSVKDATVRINDCLKILNAPYKTNSNQLNFDMCSNLILSLKEKYDYVILDLTASLCDTLENFIKLADCVIIVCECTMRSVRYGDTLAGIIEKCKINKNYLIINKLDIDSYGKNGIINSKEVLEIVAVQPIGVCPYDREMLSGNLVVDNKKSTCGKAFKNIAARLNGEKVPVLYVKKKSIFH